MNLLAQTTSTTTTTGVNFPTIIFTLLVWLPVVFALVTLLMPDRTGEQRSRIKALGASGTGAALFFALWAVQTQAADAVSGNGGGIPSTDQLQEAHGWLTSFPFTSSYQLNASGVSLALLLLFTVVFFAVALAAWKNHDRVKLLTVCLLTVETSFVGVLVSFDWVLFLLFWLLPVAPLYLLVRGFGRGQHERAAGRYAAGTLASAALLTLAVTLIVFQGGSLSFSMSSVPVTLHGAGTGVAFWLLAAAFLLTMAVVPVHGALLDLEEDGAGVLAALFAALLPSLGAYGLIEVAFGFFPHTAADFSLFFAVLSVATVLWAGFAALRTDDLRRLIGHAGNALMGLVLLGLAGHTTISVTGALYVLVARGLAMAVLMLLASGIQERTRRARISQLGGLMWQMPHTAAFWLAGILTAAGAPLLGGFLGMFMLFSGAFPAHRWATAAVLAGMVVVVGGLVWAAQRIFMGGEREGFSRARDLGPLEITYLATLVAVSLFLGINPDHLSALFVNGADHVLYPATYG